MHATRHESQVRSQVSYIRRFSERYASREGNVNEVREEILRGVQGGCIPGIYPQQSESIPFKSALNSRNLSLRDKWEDFDDLISIRPGDFEKWPSLDNLFVRFPVSFDGSNISRIIEEKMISESLGEAHGGPQTGAMGNTDILNAHGFQCTNGLVYLNIAFRVKMRAAEHGVHGLLARELPRMLNRIDDAAVCTPENNHKPFLCFTNQRKIIRKVILFQCAVFFHQKVRFDGFKIGCSRNFPGCHDVF